MTPKDDSKPAEKTEAPKNNTPKPAENEGPGAMSALDQAITNGPTSEDLNPAFASPERQAQIAKDWAEGADHTVDAEAVLKDAKDDK